MSSNNTSKDSASYQITLNRIVKKIISDLVKGIKFKESDVRKIAEDNELDLDDISNALIDAGAVPKIKSDDDLQKLITDLYK